jgi:hypothetical protein
MLAFATQRNHPLGRFSGRSCDSQIDKSWHGLGFNVLAICPTRGDGSPMLSTFFRLALVWYDESSCPTRLIEGSILANDDVSLRSYGSTIFVGNLFGPGKKLP